MNVFLDPEYHIFFSVILRIFHFIDLILPGDKKIGVSSTSENYYKSDPLPTDTITKVTSVRKSILITPCFLSN